MKFIFSLQARIFECSLTLLGEATKLFILTSRKKLFLLFFNSQFGTRLVNSILGTHIISPIVGGWTFRRLEEPNHFFKEIKLHWGSIWQELSDHIRDIQ
jgi:hypothetical protein